MPDNRPSASKPLAARPVTGAAPNPRHQAPSLDRPSSSRSSARQRTISESNSSAGRSGAGANQAPDARVSRADAAASTSRARPPGITHTYGSFPTATIEAMVKTWVCANLGCPLDARRDGFRLRTTVPDRPDVYVLKCGHFLCVECKERFVDRFTASDYFECGRTKNLRMCPGRHDVNDLRKLPPANHTMSIRSELQRRGLACSVCEVTSGEGERRLVHSRRFPRELMNVCTLTRCSQMDSLSPSLVYNLQSSSRVAQLPDKTEIRLVRLCLFCFIKGAGHRNHTLKSIDGIRKLEATMELAIDRHPVVGRDLTHRTPFHLSMITREWIDTLLYYYFACFCVESSTVLRRHPNRFFSIVRVWCARTASAKRIARESVRNVTKRVKTAIDTRGMSMMYK
ncbi:hypothetical protein PFISCL1PPCAC_11594, partial [Pristionchus fissidentatus]